MAACPKHRTRALRPDRLRWLAAGTALAALSLAAPAQAGCTIWRALAHQDSRHLRDIALQLDGNGTFELSHLGVVDGVRGAESCTLSADYSEYSVECDWPDETEAGALARLEAMQAEIESCLAASFEHRPDWSSGEGSAFIHQRDLELEQDDGLEISIDLQIYNSGRIATSGRYFSLGLEVGRDR